MPLLADRLDMCGTTLAHARATKNLQSYLDKWLDRASAFGTDLQILDKAAPNMELAWSIDEGCVWGSPGSISSWES